MVTANLSPKTARALPPKGVWDLEMDRYSDDVSVVTFAAGGLNAQADVTRTG